MTVREGRRRIWLSLVISLTTLSAGPALAATPSQPVPIEGLVVVPPPDVTAKSWILYDATYDLVLASEEPDERRAMASTTKIMSALVALDDPDVERPVTISKEADDVGEAEIGLVVGERVRLESLIKAMLIRSGNDAAVAVAEAVGGSVDGFADMMNAKADELGLENSRFENPHGLDAAGHFSSARDLLTMAKAGLENPMFAAAVFARSYRFPDAPDGTKRQAWSTNRLLTDYEGALGVKTGFTFQAGLVLVAAAERDGRTILTVVMGSEGEGAHFEDSRKLLDYGFDEYGVVPLIVEGAQYGIGRAGSDTYPLTATATAEAFIHLAAAGLLEPEVGLVDGEPRLELPRSGDVEGIDVAIDEELAPLPEFGDALGWLFGSNA